MAQMVKHLPTVQKNWVRSLGWEDPLEKGGAVVKNLPVNVGDMGSSLGQEEPLD